MPNENIMEFDLNLVPQGVPPIVHVHQYDFGTVVTLKPTLYYGKELFDDDLTSYDYIIAYARPDGSKQSYVINPTIEENTIAFPLDGAMTAVWGPNVMSIGLQNGSNNSVIWTQNFILSLERHPIQSDDYIGSSAYDGMIRTLQRYVDEAYSTTPPGYEEHIRNIEEVMSEIEQLHSDINNSYDEATQYTDEKIGGLDSVYATLDDVTQAAQEGRDYAGTLVGDIETQIVSDMSLLYTTKGEANEQEIGMQIYAEQVTEASATELRERLGIEYTEEGIDFVENGALSAEISKKANEISQTLSAEFATKEYVDGVETETKSYAESKITQKANEITTSVRQNYESKEDASSKLAASKSYTDSSITQASGAITFAVNAYTDDTLRNLKIGAANLLRGTNEFKTEDSSQGWTPSYNNGGWQKTGTAVVSEIDDPPGSGFTNQVAMTGATLAQNDIDWFVDNKEYTAHMWIKKPIGTDPNGESYLWFRDSETNEKIFVGYTDSEGDQIPTIEYEFHNPSHEEYRDPTDINGNFVVDENDILALDGGVTKVNVEDEDSEWIELDVHFRNKDWPENVDVVVGDGSTNFTFAGLKIEEGTKVTSWYPNEFDFTDFFSSRLIQTYDSVMSSVYGQYTNDENGNDIRTTWGSLSAYVNNVAGRVTTMASANYITVDDLTGSDSATHNVVTDLIKSTVSSNWENIDTIDAMGSEITTDNYKTVISSWARSDLKLGGPNILRATDTIEALVAQNKGTWSLDGWYKTSGGGATVTRIDVTNAPNNNIKKGWRFTATASTAAGDTDISQDEVPLGYQKPYTMSCYVRVTSGSGKLRFQSWRAANVYHNGPGDTGAIDVSADTHGAWTRVSWTFTHDFSDYKDQTNVHFGLQNTANTACVMEICGLKLEYGNLATDWQWSIYDVEAYTEAKIEVLNDAIKSYVLKTDYTGTNIISKVNQVDGQVYISGARVNLESNTTFTDVRTIANKVTDAIKQSSIQRLYYQKSASDSNKHTAPPKPSGSTKITTSDDVYNTWVIELPSYVSGATWWTCEQYQDINDVWHFTDVEAYNYTQIDGGNIRTGTVIVGDQLKLGGEMTVFQANKDSTTTGGYIGFGWGSDGYDSTAGMAMRSSDGSHYLHLSTKGAVLHADKYLQIYDAGAAVRIHNRSGLLLMGIGSASTASNHNHYISSQTSAGDHAPLTLQCSGLTVESSNNTTIFKAYNNDPHFIFSSSTTYNKLCLGTSERPVAINYNAMEQISDSRLKKNINYDGVPDIVDQLKPASFEYISDDSGAIHYGFIAQDILPLDSNILWYSEDEKDETNNYFTLSVHEIIPMLVLRCQKLQKQIDELKEFNKEEA